MQVSHDRNGKRGLTAAIAIGLTTVGLALVARPAQALSPEGPAIVVKVGYFPLK